MKRQIVKDKLKLQGCDMGKDTTSESVMQVVRKVTQSLPRPQLKLQPASGGITTNVSKKDGELSLNTVNKIMEKYYRSVNDNFFYKEWFKYNWTPKLDTKPVLNPEMWGKGLRYDWIYMDEYFKEKPVFKIGDKVKLVDWSDQSWYGSYATKDQANTGTIISNPYELKAGVSTIDVSTVDGDRHWKVKDIKLEGENMERRTFKLTKDMPDFKKGLLVQEVCDDGDQEYTSINHDEFVKFDDQTEYFDDNSTSLSRKSVEENPTYFVEVFKVTPEYMTQVELDQFAEFKKGLSKKATKKAGKK